MKVGVIGASGYVGGELLRLLVVHPDVELSVCTSRQNAGEYVHRIHPSLKGFINLTFFIHGIRQVGETVRFGICIGSTR